MRTFVIRARKGSTRWEKIQSDLGSKAHIEVIAHCVINAFLYSNGFRDDVDVYIILDSSEDFPRTIHLSGGQGLSINGFHEAAVLELIIQALKKSPSLQKNATMSIAPGIEISGYGFEKLMSQLLASRTVYLLDKKGDDVRSTVFSDNPVFVLSDHLVMPKNSVKGLKRQGLNFLSLGQRMLFASQCVVLLHDALDRQE